MLQLVQPQSCKGIVWWHVAAQRSSSCQHHFRSTVYAPRTQPQSPSSQHSSWRRGYWCRGCATSRQPTPSLVVDQLQAASVHACCLHNHHGHVPQPLRLMPAGMAFTRELLAAVQRDVQGGCKCKSWWPPGTVLGGPVLVVQLYGAPSVTVSSRRRD